jgi:hypothetical protein
MLLQRPRSSLDVLLLRRDSLIYALEMPSDRVLVVDMADGVRSWCFIGAMSCWFLPLKVFCSPRSTYADSNEISEFL